MFFIKEFHLYPQQSALPLRLDNTQICTLLKFVDKKKCPVFEEAPFGITCLHGIYTDLCNTIKYVFRIFM